MAQGAKAPAKQYQFAESMRANQTLPNPYLAVKFVSNNTYNWCRLPANITDQVCGIAQGACNKSKDVDVVYFGETWCYVNGTVYRGSWLVNNSSSGKLEIHTNVTAHARPVVARSLETVANGNSTKIAKIFINPFNCSA